MPRFHLVTLASVGLAAMLLVFATAAAAQGEHGLGGSTNCAGPTKIGDPVFCTYTIRNNSDDFGDTMRAHTVELTAQSAGGSIPSGNVFGSLQWVFTPAPGNPGAPTCVGGSGLGTAISPYINATSCDLPNGSVLSSLPFSFYTATAADFTLPGSLLPMLAFYEATDLCDGPATENCPTEDLTVSPNSQTMIVKRNSATATAIHDAAHQTVLTVEAGSTVHDFVMVTSADGGPVPTGNVNIDWFLNGDCSGAPAQNSGSIGPLDGAGNFDATGFSFTVNSPGMRSFKAHYEGSGTYLPSDGDCEPLEVTQQPPSVGSFTPGYWKNHQAHTTSLLPILLGNYNVNTFPKAKGVFQTMNCGNSKPQSAVGCLAGHLLAAKLNVANGGDACIAPVIAGANAFLISIGYAGPAGTYSLTGAQRNLAIDLKDDLDAYNNDQGC